MKAIITAAFLVLLCLILVSCSSGPTVTKVTSLVPVSDADSKVTKNGVTIEVIPLTATSLGAYPQLSTTAKVLDKGFLEDAPSPKAEQISNVLYGLTFAIKISNNTGHILKMAGSDIGLSMSGVDMRKLSKEEILQLWAAYFPTQYRYQTTVPQEIHSAVQRCPYWDEGLKVLPGKQAVCFAAFNTEPKEGFGQATLAIYDLVTNTDQAGNPTERTSFDFNLKELTTEVKSE